MDNPMIASLIWIFPLTVVGLLIYLIPSLIAFNKEHENKMSILAINFLAGWTIVGWIISLMKAIKD